MLPEEPGFEWRKERGKGLEIDIYYVSQIFMEAPIPGAERTDFGDTETVLQVGW